MSKKRTKHFRKVYGEDEWERMIAVVIRFYSGGIGIQDAENMSLSKLDRYLKIAVNITDEEKKEIANARI